MNSWWSYCKKFDTTFFLQRSVYMVCSGVSTQGGNGARCTMAKIGGGECCDDNDALAPVYNELLLHEYIYYFTPVHF